MKKIRLFVAGSKDLKRERETIKILANDLNSRYHDKNVMLIIQSYEHFNDNQEEYNKFIDEKADITLFILKDRIGDKTEDELFTAADAYRREGRPEVMIFLHDYEELTGEIGRIEGLIVAKLGNKYYVQYSSLEDLRAKVRDRIVRYIDSVLTERPVTRKEEPKEQATVKGPLPPKKKCRFTRLNAALCLVILVLGACLCWSLLRNPDIMIFAGGGSVKNYIEDTRGLDLNDYPNGVYSNLASGSAWALLTEEANRYQEDGERGLKNFTSICLSADDIDSTSLINEKTKGIFDQSRIIRYNLGQDSLAIYVHKEVLKDLRYPMDPRFITTDSLRSLIKYVKANPGKVNLFTTSKTSGTLRRYKSLIEPADSIDFDRMLDSKQAYLFYQNSTAAYINALDEAFGNKAYLILGSEHYFPKVLNKEEYYKLVVLHDGVPVLKPINLYFLARYDSKNPEDFIVKETVVKFLKSINSERNIAPDTWELLKDGKIKAVKGNLIISIN